MVAPTQTRTKTRRLERWRNGHRFIYDVELSCHREVARQIAQDALDPEHPLTYEVAHELICELRHRVFRAWLFGEIRSLRK